MVPLPAGSPRRLANVHGAYSPDGRQLLFAHGKSLLLAKSDGSEPRKLLTTQGFPSSPRFSPEGARVRFTELDIQQNTSSLWEAKADGAGLHAVLAGWSGHNAESSGQWTPDGAYYLFTHAEGTATLQISGHCLIATASSAKAIRHRYSSPPAPWPSITPYPVRMVTGYLSQASRRMAQGGTVQELLSESRSEMDPTWSPDGKRIAFGRLAFAEDQDIEVLDLQTHQVSVLPGSQSSVHAGRRMAAFWWRLAATRENWCFSISRPKSRPTARPLIWAFRPGRGTASISTSTAPFRSTNPPSAQSWRHQVRRSRQPDESPSLL